MFRPGGSIKDFLDLLLAHYQALGGAIRTGAKVSEILRRNGRVDGVRLASGETIHCDFLLSTIGLDETLAKLGSPAGPKKTARLGFVETIFQLQSSLCPALPRDRTIIFYSASRDFHYRKPSEPVDFSSGVICLPQNFADLPDTEYREVRSTHLANYERWREIADNSQAYAAKKAETADQSKETLERIIGSFSPAIVFQDTFTPLTIERYTAKKEGAIYGNPEKIKDGVLGYDNLFLAGTDQGFLGIVGSMLSGVSMVNQHILPRF
jgi:phytoene dehydrogenase-like protein